MKNDFPIFKNNPNLVYLDNGATSQKPKIVIDALTNFYENYNANANRGIYGISIKASLALGEARKTIAEFFNTTDEHIVFSKNSTESLNLLSRSLQVSEQNNVVITEVEHHSNFVPWQEMSKRHNFELRISKYDKESHSIEHIPDLVDENTAIVSFTAMSNVSGEIYDVKNIIKNIREKNKNTIIIIDACQWAVHESIDVEDIDADYLVCSAHKMYGPFGVGILYAKNLNNLDPFLFGGDMIESVSLEKTTYAKGPTKFEAGSIDIAGIISTAKAIEYIQNHRHATQEKEKELTKKTVKALRNIKGMKVIGHIGEKVGSIISFYHETVPALDLAHFCSNDNICIRVGQHCAEPFLNALNVHSTARISIAMYNTVEDIDKAIESIQKAIQTILKVKI